MLKILLSFLDISWKKYTVYRGYFNSYGDLPNCSYLENINKWVMGSSHFLYSSSQDFLENIQDDIPLLFFIYIWTVYSYYFSKGDVWNFHRYWIYLSETFKELQNRRFLRSETFGGGGGGGGSSVPHFEDRRAQFCSYLFDARNEWQRYERHLQVILQKWN